MWEAMDAGVYCWTLVSDRSPFKSCFHHLVTMRFQACHSNIYFLTSCEDWSGKLAFHSAWNAVSPHYRMGLRHQGLLPVPHPHHHLSLPSLPFSLEPSDDLQLLSRAVVDTVGCLLYLFPLAAVTNDNKQWLKTTQSLFSYNCGGQKSEMSFSGLKSRH